MEKIVSNSVILKVIIAIYMPFVHLQENQRSKIKKIIIQVWPALYISGRFCISESSLVEYLHKKICVMQVGINFGVVSTHLGHMVYNWPHWSTVITKSRQESFIRAVIRTQGYFPCVNLWITLSRKG